MAMACLVQLMEWSLKGNSGGKSKNMHGLWNTSLYRGGRMWGYGLLTYSDGSPCSEGFFQESKFKEEGCKEAIKRARRVAMLARRCAEEFKATCDFKISLGQN